jgi:hypothetical protein
LGGAVKLGKKPLRHDTRTFKLSTYLTTEAPPPVAVDNSHLVSDWGMYANDRLSDCTVAAAAHMIKVFSVLAHTPVVPPEAEVISLYEQITGGVDDGAVELDVLKRWREQGLAGVKPYAFAFVEPEDVVNVKRGTALFSGLYIGLLLPLSAQAEIEAGKPWQASSDDPGGWGGHAVNIVQYDGAGLTCVTWSKLQVITWEFFAAYCDEAWAILPSDWDIPDTNFQQLQSDLARVGAEQ